MPNIDYKGLATKLFCFFVFALIGVLFFKYIFSYTLPFLVAWGIAYLVYPLAQKLSQKCKVSRKICSFMLVLFILVALSSFVFLIANRLLYEMQDLFAYLTENDETIARNFEKIFDFFNSIGKRLPIFNKLNNSGLSENLNKNLNALFESVWKSLLERLGSAVPDVASKMVIALPNIFLVGLISVISCFYFAIDIDVIHKSIKKALPSKITEGIVKFKNRMIDGFKKYLKAYCILFLITFTELLIGFWILRVDYALALAIIVALVDFLPVFGAGAVLAPWGIIALLMKNYFLGVGMIILFVAMTIIRQIIEPKIVGESLGVHPILTLITLYFGYKLFGIWGMVVLPILILVIFSKNDDKNKEK